MVDVKKSLTIAKINMRKLLHNPRLYLLLSMMVLLAYEAVLPIREFCMSVGYRITPWVFPFLMAQPYYGMVFLLGLVLLFCDAPFLDAGQVSVVVRGGKQNWCAGQLFYIVACTGLYFLCLFIISCVLLAPVLVVQADWGKVITTLASTNIRAGGIRFPIEALQHFSGLEASLLSLVMYWLSGSLLGLTMFCINLKHNQAGAVVGTGIVLLRSLVSFLGGSKIGRIFFSVSPFSFIQLKYITSVANAVAACGALLAGVAFVGFLSRRVALLGDIQTLPEI